MVLGLPRQVKPARCWRLADAKTICDCLRAPRTSWINQDFEQLDQVIEGQSFLSKHKNDWSQAQPMKLTAHFTIWAGLQISDSGWATWSCQLLRKEWKISERFTHILWKVASARKAITWTGSHRCPLKTNVIKSSGTRLDLPTQRASSTLARNFLRESTLRVVSSHPYSSLAIGQAAMTSAFASAGNGNDPERRTSCTKHCKWDSHWTWEIPEWTTVLIQFWVVVASEVVHRWHFVAFSRWPVIRANEPALIKNKRYQARRVLKRWYHQHMPEDKYPHSRAQQSEEI